MLVAKLDMYSLFFRWICRMHTRKDVNRAHLKSGHSINNVELPSSRGDIRVQCTEFFAVLNYRGSFIIRNIIECISAAKFSSKKNFQLYLFCIIDTDTCLILIMTMKLPVVKYGSVTIPI